MESRSSSVMSWNRCRSAFPLRQFFLHRDVFQRDVSGNAVLAVGRWGFAADQGLEVGAGLVGDAVAVATDEVLREHLLVVGHLVERGAADLPAIRLVGRTHDDRHGRVMALECELHRRLAHGDGLFDIGLGGDVARGALQVVGQGPVHLVAECILDLAGQVGGDTAKLGVAEGILAATGVGDESAIGGLDAFAGDDHAVADALDYLLHLLEEVGFVVRPFREQDEVRCFIRTVAGQACGGGQPAGVAAHGFVDEDLGRCFSHRGHVQCGLAHGYGGVFGSRAEARAAVGDGEVVVDGLGHADAGERVAELGGQLRDLVGGVGGVVAAVVEEPAHVVRLEDLQQALVLGAVGFDRLELVAARTERAAGRMRQGANGGGGFLGGVHQFLAQGTEDAVAGRQHLDLAGAGLADDAGRGGVDDGGDTAGLGVQEGSGSHGRLWS